MSSKINAVVDGRGLPVRIVITPGQASDKAAVDALFDGLPAAPDVVADRGYDAIAIVEKIEARGGRAHIPTQKDRKLQRTVRRDVYRQRNLVERFFNRLKHFRRVATRYERNVENFLAAVLLASTRLWIRFESRT